MEWKIKVVLRDEYGGFSLTGDMYDMLKKRGCKWVERCGEALGREKKYYLPSSSTTSSEDHSLRKDPDLVAVVEELTKKYDTMVEGDDAISWQDRSRLRRTMLGDLKVQEVTISVEIKDHDGKESVRVCGGAW